ncbi:MAG: enoyl-CoA hydratase/isomerase family protein, partial [Acidobacteriota bacterium]|nr:enoyl-CoA hydratase/isomerase family protein [Acidobacteriota bacterium]
MTHIVIDITDAVGTITIDRRERFNSLDVETARELRKAGLQMARDASVRAVILRGTGGVFCSGADLKDIRERARNNSARRGVFLRRGLQGNPRIHPQHHLRDSPRAETVHRR